MDFRQLFYAVIIIFTVYLLIVFIKYSAYNTSKRTGCDQCREYYVHNIHTNQDAAALLINEINIRNRILIDHLRSKYLQSTAFSDPYKSGRIDVIQPSEIYLGAIQKLDTNRVESMNYVQERVEQLVSHYNEKSIYEISPLNKTNVTSYTQDKKTLILCLRHKNGKHELHDINIMMFVVIHELSHMMNNQWGHQTDFWTLFKFMLQNATECGTYQPVDYRLHPVRYCGIWIQYSPLFDNSLPMI